MKLRPIALAALAAAGFAAPGFAQTIYADVDAPAYPSGRIYVAPQVAPSGAIHGGAVTAADEALLSDAVAAFAADRRLDGSTVTLVANNGELKLNGSAKDEAQATRMEMLAKKVSNGRAI